VVRGVEPIQVLLGWDTITEEEIVLDGKTNSISLPAKKGWHKALLVTGRREKIHPRSVQKIYAQTITGSEEQPTVVEIGQEGVCIPIEPNEVGMWDCISKVTDRGVLITLINTGDKAVTLEEGRQIGIMYDHEARNEEIKPLSDRTIASDRIHIWRYWRRACRSEEGRSKNNHATGEERSETETTDQGNR
jgi:hypothetical protein